MVALHVFTFEIGCEYTANMRATPSMNFGVPVSQALFQQLWDGGFKLFQEPQFHCIN
jgi:hypothetical protein